MDVQTLLNIAFAVAGFFGVWTINSLSRSIIRLEDKVAEIPIQYVAKDDYRHDITEIKDMLSKIFDRLDSKQDK
jgi:hypothetical protein